MIDIFIHNWHQFLAHGFDVYGLEKKDSRSNAMNLHPVIRCIAIDWIGHHIESSPQEHRAWRTLALAQTLV